MKRFLLLVCTSVFILLQSCNNSNNAEPAHTHDDGSTHGHDTVKPLQQEFTITDTIKKDTSTHSHDDGKKHDH